MIGGYSEYRDAAAEAIRRADCVPIRAEDHPASSSSPRSGCIDMVRSSDAVVFLLGSRHGYRAPSGKSVTEEEYDEARRSHKRILVFLEADVEREPRQEAFVARLQDYIEGHWRKEFATASELTDLIQDAISEADIVRTSSDDRTVAAQRIAQILRASPTSRDDLAWIVTAWTTIRSEEVTDPVAFEDSAFQRRLKRIAHECEPPLLDYDPEKTTDVGVDLVWVSQGDPTAWSDHRDLVKLVFQASGTLAVWQNVTGLEPRGVGDWGRDFYIDPKVVSARPKSAWAFASAWWEAIDPYKRHDPLLYQVGLVDVGTRRLAEMKRSSRGGTYVSLDESPENPILAYDAPRTIARAGLEAPDTEMARAVKMLRRRLDSWAR